MRDEWFGYPPGEKVRLQAAQGLTEAVDAPWLEWDFALADAFQTIESYTDEYGLHAWEVADEAVDVAAIRKINKFLAAKDAQTSRKSYKALPGEYFVPRVSTRRETGEYWTFDEWIKAETDKMVADQID